MANKELIYLNTCKKQIEDKLNWPGSSEWKQRDFLNLIDLINDKTGICLSLSTLKRIWKSDYTGTPHPSTLDAFALFLDYDNWLDYKNKNFEENDGAKNNFNRNTKRILVLGTILVLLFGYIFIQSKKNPESTSGVFYNPDEIEFSCNTTVAQGVPNTVIFTYNTSKVQADSFFIQQSWDRLRRDQIKKLNTKLTSTYMYPGYHKAKLIANDSIIKEVGVRVNSNGWLAMTRYSFRDASPTYIRNKEVKQNGKLAITAKHLQKNKVEINKNLISSYYLIDNFTGLNSSNFTFETKLKCDSLMNINCPVIAIIITGEGDMNYIPLMPKGCVGDAFVKIGNVMLSGKNNDLSLLGTDIYNWQHFKIEVINKRAKVYLNHNIILDTTFVTNIKEITGCNLNFSGTGSIDFVRFYNEHNELVYSENFD